MIPAQGHIWSIGLIFIAQAPPVSSFSQGLFETCTNPGRHQTQTKRSGSELEYKALTQNPPAQTKHS